MIALPIKSKLLGLIAFGVVGVAVLGYGGYRIYVLQNEVQKMKSSPQSAQANAREEAKKLVAEVSKLISVPSDEDPTVATVEDSEKLKSTPFFANAQNGDRVLIYSTAKKAIIYRPGENKIIEVGPISIGTPSASVASATTTTDKISFVLYNAAGINGLTKKYEAELTSKVAGSQVLTRDNATKRDAETTVLVVLNKERSAQADQIAKALGISVSPLPAGETVPKTGDFLILVGQDKQ
jgi:hypothetical protein